MRHVSEHDESAEEDESKAEDAEEQDQENKEPLLSEDELVDALMAQSGLSINEEAKSRASALHKQLS